MRCATTFVYFVFIGAGFAQQSKDGIKFPKGIKDLVTTIFKGEMKVTGDQFVEIAEAMPAEKYGFRPTPQQHTFAGILVRVIGKGWP